MSIRLLALFGAIFALSGCLALGVNGSAQPSDNTAVEIGASVDESGAIKPSGRMILDLF